MSLLFHPIPPVFRRSFTPSFPPTSQRPRTHRCLSPPAMIQSPMEDGPPDLNAFFDKKRQSIGKTGSPIAISTSRQLLTKHDSSAAAAIAALDLATNSLSSSVRLVHLTTSLDFDLPAAASAIQNALSDGVNILARTVNKSDTVPNLQLLLLGTDESSDCAFAVASGEESLDILAQKATEEALTNLEAECTFLVFVCTPAEKSEEAVRAGIDRAKNGIVAYGGPAVGEQETAQGWSLYVGRELHDSSKNTVGVAVVAGSLPFLLSAVVKNWVQPKYVEPLPFMHATYVDEPEIDLLTAIRYDDWDKFIDCIEGNGVDVNVKWTTKQSQSPLLAACARVRTRMVTYLLEKGADVSHRNDGGFTAIMYTRMLTDFDRGAILAQLDMLEKAGANISLTDEEAQLIKKATNGKIVD